MADLLGVKFSINFSIPTNGVYHYTEQFFMIFFSDKHPLLPLRVD